MPEDGMSVVDNKGEELQLAVLQREPMETEDAKAADAAAVEEKSVVTLPAAKTHEDPDETADEVPDFEELPPSDDCWQRLFERLFCSSAAEAHRDRLISIAKRTAVVAAALAYLIYMAYCCYLLATKFCGTAEVEQSVRLLWVSALAIAVAAINWAPKRFKDAVKRGTIKLLTNCDPFLQLAASFWWVPEVVIIVAFLLWMAVQNLSNLVSACGLVILLLFSLVISAHPNRVNWKPVIGGIVIQLVFAALILRTSAGFASFNFLSDRTTEFLGHCAEGSKMVFGTSYEHHFFAFKILPVIIYFSSALTVLFHFGVLQAIICRIGSVMQAVMGTTAAESMVASANIFVGQIEAPLMVRPFLKVMTNSEIHSIMTSGFATIAGGVMAAYISMGVPARHLLSASVMSAPAALAISKLVYPETRKSQTRVEDVKRLQIHRYGSVVEAAGAGAIASLAVIGSIAANLVAFVSILAFINATITWLGYRAGLSFPLTFEFLLSFVFWPLALVMGVPPRDCRQVAELIGVKTFLNEFIAYQRLSAIKANYKTLVASASVLSNITDVAAMGSITDLARSWVRTDLVFPSLNLTLPGGVLFDDRSFVIATYSLCGFSNLGSMGAVIGALTVMAPNRRSDISQCALRAMVAGNIACFMTACIAGLFFSDADLVLKF